MYILSTGCQWRAIPKDLPPRSTLHDYFDLWSWCHGSSRVAMTIFFSHRILHSDKAAGLSLPGHGLFRYLSGVCPRFRR
jgi:transposase